MAVKIKNRHRLKERDVKELAADLQARFGVDFLNGKVSGRYRIC